MFFEGLLELAECDQQPVGLTCVDTQPFKRYAVFLLGYAFSGSSEMARGHGEDFVHAGKRGRGVIVAATNALMPPVSGVDRQFQQ